MPELTEHDQPLAAYGHLTGPIAGRKPHRDERRANAAVAWIERDPAHDVFETAGNEDHGTDEPRPAGAIA